MPATRYDVWLPSLGPSEALLEGRLTSSWGQFVREYRKELWTDGPIDRRCATIKNHGQKSLLRLLKHLGRRSTVTLMCHCDEDQVRCHRHTLKKIIQSSKIKV